MPVNSRPRPSLPRRSFVLALAAALSAPAAAAPPVGRHAHRPATVADAHDARKLVQAQLDAFAADDAERAFGYATSAIREAFGAPDRFLAMVKSAYPVVYRPSSVSFLKAAWIEGSLTQVVQLTDEAGLVWLAVYSLERQQDKRWAIAGCELFPSPGRRV